MLFAILLVLHMTKGVPGGIIISQLDYSRMPDGKAVSRILLIWNILIMAICLMVSVVITINKNNNIKNKWIVLLILTVYLFFIPVIVNVETGGLMGEYYRQYWSLFSSINM